LAIWIGEDLIADRAQITCHVTDSGGWHLNYQHTSASKAASQSAGKDTAPVPILAARATTRDVLLHLDPADFNARLKQPDAALAKDQALLRQAQADAAEAAAQATVKPIRPAWIWPVCS
jgi:hypothetical protein